MYTELVGGFGVLRTQAALVDLTLASYTASLTVSAPTKATTHCGDASLSAYIMHRNSESINTPMSI